MKIRVHIDRLVLDGVPLPSGSSGLETARLRSAVESELAKLLARSGLGPELAAGRRLARIDAPPLQAASDRPATGHGMGQAIAHSVHGALAGAGAVKKGKMP
ncbi:hypothetical protein LMG28688_05780 [Paraburkholderia caffeinitolerans]|uniref:Uncharacterized protein n=1 Tax=Paraburkholderia caffeinitolerans TaxID=1723730 RepID=A0A6J5GQJ0_9BURK|nr:hypothetical protein [Paraburkholderia caffeinitolerans]CAB3803400.1 hypothetical protein LMG28688_05780 [Paraburkholderia caffeinitolerans]